VLRRQSAGTARVDPWPQQPAAIRLTPPGEPGQDRLELRFSIDAQGELLVEGRDLLSQAAIPTQRLGSVR